MIVGLLEQILLIVMILEILYTVQVSFREHVISPDPFLIMLRERHPKAVAERR